MRTPRSSLAPLLVAALGCGAGPTPGLPGDPEVGGASSVASGSSAETSTGATVSSSAASSTTTGAGGAGGSPSTGGSGGAPPGEDCSKYPFSASVLLSELIGFGAGTTGGDPGNVYHVTTLADAGPGSLRDALEGPDSAWIVFDVEGTITLVDSIHVQSNKTVDGRGRDVTVDGTVKLDEGTENVVFSDIAMTYPAGFATSDGDVLGLRGAVGADPTDPEGYDSKHFWFHHLELYKGGDGLLDVRGATEITISWCHMHSHAKAFLHARDTNNLPSPGMRITYHHDWFEKITRRGPQFHYGLADYFNNYQEQWYEFGATSQVGAQFLSEANVYEARPGTYCFVPCPDPNSPTGDGDFEISKTALVSGWDTDKGYIRSVGDVTLEDAQIEEYEPAQVFDRAMYYAATPEPAGDALIAALEAGAGPRKTYCKP